jgi:hypothetical protein
VKGMTAFWQQPKLIFRLKFTQTNSTVKRVLQSYNGFVVEHRESIYKCLVNTSIMKVKELLQLTLESSHTL